MSVLSLTPVQIKITISNNQENISLENILISNISIETTLDNITEATIGIEFTSKVGQATIDSLFPLEGQGAYYSIVTIKIIGTDTPVSKIKKDHILFQGYIIGYGRNKTGSGTQFYLNARGGLYQLGQILIAAPGFHPSSPVSWGQMSLSASAEGNSFLNLLLLPSQNNSTGWAIYKNIITSFLDKIAGSVGSTQSFLHSAFISASKSFAVGSTQRTIVENELNNVTELSDLTLPATLNSVAGLRGIATRAFQNSQLTMWNFLQEVCQYFGLTIITIGGNVFILSYSPLDTPVLTISPSDIASMQLSDAPFSSPTRTILSVLDPTSSFAEGGFSDQDVTMYPKEIKLTTQEEKTGVKSIYLSAPTLLAFVQNQDVINLINNRQNHLTFDNSSNKKGYKNLQKARTRIPPDTSKLEIYAKYMYMMHKFKQRLGTILHRYCPEIIPGFSIFIDDDPKFTAYVYRVKHVIDSTSIITELTFSHIRYGKELDPNPFPNALYPSFSSLDAYKQLIEKVGYKDVSY